MRALVLSGGGSKGPFHVGAIRRLVGDLGIDYRVLCGVSVGALVAGFMAMFPAGRERAAVEELEELFLGVENRDVWRHWFLFGRVAGLWKPSLLNSEPLQELVHDRLGGRAVKTSGKLLRVGAVNLSQGRYQVFTEEHTPLHQALLASAAFPGFYLPIDIGGELFADGGVQVVTPIKSAIDAGATSIDVVITEPEHVAPFVGTQPRALDILLRSLELAVHRLTWVDVRRAQEINELVAAGAAPKKRHVDIRVIAPSSSLNSDSMNFDPEEAREIASVGYAKAVELDVVDGEI